MLHLILCTFLSTSPALLSHMTSRIPFTSLPYSSSSQFTHFTSSSIVSLSPLTYWCLPFRYRQGHNNTYNHMRPRNGRSTQEAVRYSYILYHVIFEYQHQVYQWRVLTFPYSCVKSTYCGMLASTLHSSNSCPMLSEEEVLHVSQHISLALKSPVISWWVNSFCAAFLFISVISLLLFSSVVLDIR